MTKNLARLVLSAAFGAALGGLSPAAPAAIVDVYVFDFELSIYRPDEGPIVDPIIFEGDTIRWVWLHDFHNVMACVNQSEYWESDVFEAGATFVYQFNSAGVYQYYCAPHGHDNFDGTYTGMGGSITVLPVPAPGTSALFALVGTPMLLRRRR